MSFAPYLVAAGLTKRVAFRLEHPTFAKNPEFTGKEGQRLWLRTHGCPINEGNYKLFYHVPVKRPFKLRLEIGDHHRTVDVSQVNDGMGIGRRDLEVFLNHVAALGCWAPQDVKCRLVVTKDRVETTSDWVTVKTPVKPWSKDPYQIEEFTTDKTLRYCGDLDQKIFYGRILKAIGDRYYFTFRDSLESDAQLRGFACIGLVGNVYRIAPGPAYQRGDAMAAAVNGTAFEGWGKKRDRAVVMNRAQVLNFVKSPAAVGSYMIWIDGHAGLIRNGVLYECKPSGRGFTKETYTEGSDGAVRKYGPERLPSELKAQEEFFLSRLPH